MSAAECAAWVDDLIREQQGNAEASLDDKEALRRWQEVSYHLHWHCANLDGK